MKKNYVREITCVCKTTKQLKKALKKLFKTFKVAYTGECAMVKASTNDDSFRVAYSEYPDREKEFSTILDEPAENLVWVKLGESYEKSIVDYVKKNFDGTDFIVRARYYDITDDGKSGDLLISIIGYAYMDNNGNISDSRDDYDEEDDERGISAILVGSSESALGGRTVPQVRLLDNYGLATELIARSMVDEDKSIDEVIESIKSAVVERVKEMKEHQE